MKKKVVGLVILLFIGSLAAFVFSLKGWVGARNSESPEEVIYEVTYGSTFMKVAEDLQREGVVRHAGLFYLWSRIKGKTSKLKTGEYLLHKAMTPDEVLTVISSGKSIGRFFTVAEGLNMFDIADLYESQKFGTAEEFLRHTRDKAFIKELLGTSRESLEGYLFPETYQITKKTSVKELISQMVKRFLYVWDEVSSGRTLPVELKTPHEVVTLASIVEKETSAPEERPLIASVFFNRLRKGMLLQTDPTILYGMWVDGREREISIRRDDILRPTRYNTYVIKGLPPGPISNPGKDALISVFQPASSDYFYFVSRNDGTHIFSETYQDHAKAVREYQSRRRSVTTTTVQKPVVQAPMVTKPVVQKPAPPSAVKPVQKQPVTPTIKKPTSPPQEIRR